MNQKDFTFKSIFFALLCLLIVCAFPAYSAKVLKLEGAIRGYLPILPLFLIVVLSCAWNMAAAKFSREMILNTKELAVIYCLMMVVSWIPNLEGSLVRYLILPRYDEMTSNATWKDAGVTSRLPKELFPAGEKGEPIGERVHFGFIQGGLSYGNVPYEAWIGPMLRWLPMLLVLSLCVLALSFLLHRQWTYHEQLRYPLSAVIDSLIHQDESRPGIGQIYLNKLFLAGFIFVFCFHLLRYLNDWFPSYLPKVPAEYSLNWASLFPIMTESNAGNFCLGWMPVSFAIIGIAFFVPSDVSLSIGLTAPLGTLIAVQYYLTTGNPISSGDLDIFRAGGFIAFGMILIYTGRTYYFPLIWKAFVPGSRSDLIERGEVWAARIFLASYVTLIIIFRIFGIDLLISWIYTSFLLLVFLVVTRLVCETGIPTIAPSWSLPGLMTGLLGPAAIGAAPLVFMGLLNQTMSNSMMPYMATSLKILDDNKVNLRRFAFLTQPVIAVVLVLCIITTLALSYTRGEGKLENQERDVITKSVTEIMKLKDTGQLEASEAAYGLGKLKLIRADGRTVGYVLGGIVAVLIFYGLRFRFSKWPLHPIFLILLGTWMGQSTWFAFLLGWGIKNLVVKFGGGSAYNFVKPLFVGLIIGEFLCVALSFVVGLIYHLCTGGLPVDITIFVG